MSPPPLQQTRYNAVQQRLAEVVLGRAMVSWRAASLLLLALLLGFLLGANLTTFVLFAIPGGRPIAVLAMVIVVESLVRLRSRLVRARPSFGWQLCDNLRIGAVYSVVLEAFKVGT
jgi:hypothetical protein